MMDGTSPIDSPEAALARIEASIQESLNRLIDGGRIADRHRARAAEFRRRLASLLRKRRASGGASGRANFPAAARSHFDLLSWDFQRWLAEIDDEFAECGKSTPSA